MREDINDVAPSYYAVPPLKFIAMSICTFGIYEIYWSYKNWQFVRDRDDRKIMPFWRAFFYPLWHYMLLSELNKSLQSSTLSSIGVRAFLAVLVFVLNALWKLPDPYWLVSILTFAGFLPVLLAMRTRAPEAETQQQTRSFHPSNLVAYLLGGPMVAFVVLGTIGFLPSTIVVPGHALWDRDIEYLRAANILGPGEEIEYFYSEGVFSISEGGQFVSDEFVTTYYRDYDTGETYIDYASYAEIVDVDVAWAQSFFDVTIVTITTGNDYQFHVWLSPEAGGDRRFVEALKARWNKYRRN